MTALNDVKVVKHDLKPQNARKPLKNSKKGDKLTSLVINADTRSPKKQISGSGLEAEDCIKAYQSIYAYVKEMLIDLGVKNIHSNELREFIKTLELDLAESSKGKTQQFMNNTLKNMAIFSVHNFCYTRAIDLLKETDTRLFTVFKALHEILNGYIRSYFESILSIDSLLLQMKNQSREVEKEAIDHTSDILTRAETLLEENERIEQEFHRKRREWEDEKKDLQRQMKEQEKENRELLDKILKLSKERAADPSKVLTPTLNSQASVGNILTTTRNVGDKTIRTQGTKTGRATANDAAARSPRGLQKNASPSMGNIRKSVESVQLSTLKNSTPPPKLLTLSHLRTIFRDLFASKKAHDLKCMQNGLPLETLEQYLYTFLSTRFGLKNLVVEWIDAILSAVAHFSKDDHEIALFGKILQNEIDEEFRVVQSEVRRTLGELIKVLFVR